MTSGLIVFGLVVFLSVLAGDLLPLKRALKFFGINPGTVYVGTLWSATSTANGYSFFA